VIATGEDDNRERRINFINSEKLILEKWRERDEAGGGVGIIHGMDGLSRIEEWEKRMGGGRTPG